MTDEIVDDKVFAATINELIRYNVIFYERIASNLSELQLNFLKAFASMEKRLSSSEVINKNNLGTSGNVETLKKALMNKEILNFSSGDPEFEDPLFRYWFTKTFL